VLAIDINPSILKWVRGRDRALNHDLFFDPRVTLRLGEGRHVVRSADHSFDVIVIHAIDTYAAASSGAYALTENFLYTKEAFQDYYRALSDEGVLTISRWMFYPPREDLRLFNTALAGLADLGVEDPKRHLLMVGPVADYKKLGDKRVWGYLAMSKRPLSEADVAAVKAHVDRLHWSLLYAPGMRTDTPFDELAHTDDPAKFQRAYPYLVSRCRTPARTCSSTSIRSAAPRSRRVRDWATVNIYQWSALTLVVALIACTVVSFLAIIAPLMWVNRARSNPDRGRVRLLGAREAIYFAGLGVGYMALEVPVIQVLSMYLGHPTYGFAVVLVALLIATGIGSLLGDRLDPQPWLVCAIVAVLLSVVAASIFPFLHATLDLSDPARFSIALLLVVICGIPMGMPLALAVRRLGSRDARSVAWAWGVNGAASVIGACLVMVAMVFAGSQVALVGAVACYAIAAVTARTAYG
jgi:xanthosine utilization system XapX-like protein